MRETPKRRNAETPKWLGVIALSLCAAGCQQNRFSTSIWNPLGLELPFTLAQKPVRIGVVAQKKGILAPENWLPVRPAPPYAGLRAALAEHLGTGVQVEEFTPFQIAAHLESGRLQYALLSEQDYATMNEEFGSPDAPAADQETTEKTEKEPDAGPGAAPPDEDRGDEPPGAQGPAWRQIARGEVLVRRGLIVASAKSDIQELSQIAGKRFAFGPKGDPVLDEGALGVLEAAGVGKDKIAKELLPISSLPNLDLLQYHVNSFEAAKEVVYGIGTPAGVIEESEYNSFPETGGRLLPLRFAKDNFRVLGKTDEVRSETTMAGPVLASGRADPELTERVKAFLAAAGTEHQPELQAIGLARFDVSATAAPEGARLAQRE